MNIAPDAGRLNERTIKLAYDALRQRYTASKVREDELGRNEIVLWAWRDSDPHHDDFETLKSWGLLIQSVPYLPDGRPAQCVNDCHYMLHDTPMVRGLLKKLDTEQGRRLTESLTHTLERADKEGWVLGEFALNEDGNVTWTPVELGQISFLKK